jgi:hypothetical protein
MSVDERAGVETAIGCRSAFRDSLAIPGSLIEWISVVQRRELGDAPGGAASYGYM